MSENGWFRMLRTHQFKYTVSDSAGNSESLIDMKSDPGEMTNLVDNPKFRDVLVEHREYLNGWNKVSNDKQGSKFVKRAQG